jgi:hypothetical protein
VLLQKWPPGHDWHCDAEDRCVRLLKVPMGHRNSVPKDVPAGQYEPVGQRVGMTVLPEQKNAAGHVRHTDWPVWFWNEPAAHGCALALPSGQNEPSGHSVVADASPPAHTKPASHKRVGYAVPMSGHVKPAKHGWQSDKFDAPVVLPKRPGGHAVGVALPAGQYEPSGHAEPVTLSVGAGSAAPPKHT